MILKKFAENFVKKILFKILLVFKFRSPIFFRRKLAKIAEKLYHNIDPRYVCRYVPDKSVDRRPEILKHGFRCDEVVVVLRGRFYKTLIRPKTFWIKSHPKQQVEIYLSITYGQ
jgi:hypothetical protein